MGVPGQKPGWEVPPPAAQEPVVRQMPGSPLTEQGPSRLASVGEMENAIKRRAWKDLKGCIVRVQVLDEVS